MSETPSLTGSLAGLTSLLGNLKGMLQKPESDEASTVPLTNPVCAWSSPTHDGDLAQFPLTRFVTDCTERFFVEQATSRAALGEPIWKPLPLNLPLDALKWLSSSWIHKEDPTEERSDEHVQKLQALNKAVHSLGTLVRAQAEGEIAPSDLQKAAHQTLGILGLTTGAVLRQNERGFYVTSSVSPTISEPTAATRPTPEREGEEIYPEAKEVAKKEEATVLKAPPYTPGDETPSARLRVEWIASDEPRKLVYDPRQQVIRYYQGATTKPTFVLQSICSESDFVALAESLKRAHA